MAWLCPNIRNYLSRTQPLSNYSQIPGFCLFESAYRYAINQLRDGDSLVEIGSFLGHSTAMMAHFIRESGKKVNFFAVDPWRDDSFVDSAEVAQTIGTNGSYKHEVEKALKELGLEKYVTLVQATSETAAAQFSQEGRRFKWIFIDGLHDYENVRKDLQWWTPLLTPDGSIAGDDYKADDVKRAVAEYFQNNYEVSDGVWPYWLKRPNYLRGPSDQFISSGPV